MTSTENWQNPYIIGRSIDEPELFFGRESLFRFIEDNLSNNQRVILLHGQRRIGKSSVLKQIPKQVRLDHQFVFILLDFQDKSQWSLDQIIHYFIQKLAQEIFEDSEDATDRIDSASIEGLEEYPNEFRKLLHSIVQKLGSKNLVLLLDEFDTLASNNNDSIFEDLFRYLKTIVSEEKQLFIIPVVGRRLTDMPKLLKLFKGAPNQKIGLLERVSTQRLITKPARKFLEYNEGAINEIFRLSAGHPYFTQAICYALFVQAREEEKSDILGTDVGRAIDKAIELSEAGLDWFRQGLFIRERVIFSAVAAAQENAKQSHSPPENSLNLLENHGVKIEQILREQLLQAQQTLSENDFLDPSGYRVTVEFVRRWLIKYYPLRSEIWELEKLDDEANNYYEGADKWRIRGDIDRELEHYNMALELNPNHFNALFRLAPGHKKKQRFDEALQLYERAYRIHPQRVKEEYIESLMGSGDNLIQKNGFIETNLSVVKKLYERVLEIEPYNMEAQKKLRELKDKENAQVYDSNKFKAIPIRHIFLTAALAVPLVIGIGIFWGLRTQQAPDFILGKSELDQLERERFSSGEQRIFGRYKNTNYKDNNKDDDDQFLICNKKFKISNYKEAVTCFQELVNDNRNDPEPLIYYNNSLARENNNNPLKIAVVVPADKNSKRAKAILRGVAQAQNEYNRNYYFSQNSSLLEIIIANDSNDDEISPKVAQGIVRDKNILGVIGHNSSDATKAALEVYEKEKLAVISSTSTSIELKGDAFFRTVIDDSVASKKLAEYVKFRSIEKIVIFYNKESSFSKSINGFFDFYLTILNPDIKVKNIDLKQPSFDLDKEVWVAAKNQVEAGALFASIGTIDLAIEIAKANYRLPENQRLNLIAGDSFYNCDILKKGGEALKGLILSIPWFKELDTAKEFVARAKAQWGGEVGWRTATSYDATKAFISALSNSGDNPTRSKVLEKLKEVNLPPNETSGQNLKFSPERELAGQAVLVEVVESQNPACSNLDFSLINKGVSSQF